MAGLGEPMTNLKGPMTNLKDPMPGLKWSSARRGGPTSGLNAPKPEQKGPMDWASETRA